MRDELLAHNHLAGAVTLQMRGFFFGMRARDDREVRVDRPRLLDDLPAFKTIGHRNKKATGRRVVRGLCEFWIGGIADDRFDAMLAKSLDNILITLDHQERH